jgi:RimJ/RimL family protein N-acetyltransferase
MKHSIVLNGYGCRLRPVEIGDAKTIVDLRRSPFAAPYLGDTSPDVLDQEIWLERYFMRDGDYYWMIDDEGQGETSVGTFSLYDVSGQVGTVGRWVQAPDATFSAVAPTLLAYRYAFEELNLERLVFNVVASNKKVLRFHRLLGEQETHVERAGQIIKGMPVDFVWFEVTKQAWPALYARWNSIIS